MMLYVIFIGSCPFFFCGVERKMRFSWPLSRNNEAGRILTAADVSSTGDEEEEEKKEAVMAMTSHVHSDEEEVIHYDLPSSPGTVSTTEADQALLLMGSTATGDVGSGGGTNNNRMRNNGRRNRHRKPVAVDPLDAISLASSPLDGHHPMHDGHYSDEDEMDQRRQLLTDVSCSSYSSHDMNLYGAVIIIGYYKM